MEVPEFKDFAKEMVDYIANYLENIRERYDLNVNKTKFHCDFLELSHWWFFLKKKKNQHIIAINHLRRKNMLCGRSPVLSSINQTNCTENRQRRRALINCISNLLGFV